MSCWANPCMHLDPSHLCGLDKATAQENNKLFQGSYSFQVNVSVLWHLLELLQIAWMCPVNIRSFAGHPWNFLTKAILHWYLASRINGKVKKKKKNSEKILVLTLSPSIYTNFHPPPPLSVKYIPLQKCLLQNEWWRGFFKYSSYCEPCSSTLFYLQLTVTCSNCAAS